MCVAAISVNEFQNKVTCLSDGTIVAAVDFLRLTISNMCHDFHILLPEEQQSRGLMRSLPLLAAMDAPV